MNTLITIAAVMNLSVCGGVNTGRLLGVDGGTFSAEYEIDIDTGEASVLHFFDKSPSVASMALGPDGTLYAGVSGAELVILDPDTADLTVIGPFGVGFVSGLAFAPDGTLYGFDGSNNELLTVDVLTGQATPVGFVVETAGTGLAFTQDGMLYLIGNPVGGSLLYSVDPTTGEGTEVGPLGPDLDFSVALAAIGNVLYASSHWCFGPPYELLVTVDRETGEASMVGGYCANGCKDGPFMHGLAFLPGPGDVDRDGDVDFDDFDIFVSCFTGPDPKDELPVGCLFLDTDDDGDIDCDDWEVFIDAWTEDEDPPTFEPCEPCEGDANGDGEVNPLDSGFVLARFGCAVGEGDPACDLADQNGDLSVNPLDVGFVLSRFGPCEDQS